MTTIPLDTPPKATMLRLANQTKSQKIVDRKGGDFKAGLIVGLSAITRGEALGHRLWIDDEFLDQVAAALDAAGAFGHKSRFTHPDLSADGLAKYLGRVKTGYVDDGQVFTDLHLAKSAHRSPDGDLASYVMDRTEEDPGSFGASIVFYRDLQAETEFALANGATVTESGYVKWDDFKSPDEANAKNYPHARLASLEAADLVDEPAANPNGMFHRGPIDEIGRLADFALGLSDETPAETTALNVDPERMRGWVERYLANRGLKIVAIEDDPEEPDAHHQPPDASTVAGETDPPPTDASTSAAATEPETPKPDRPLADYCAAFGLHDGARFYLDNKPFAEAQAETLAALKAENEQLRARAALADKEQPDALSLSKANSKSLSDLIRIRSRS